jgi:cation diffusion facilitator family transporter
LRTFAHGTLESHLLQERENKALHGLMTGKDHMKQPSLRLYMYLSIAAAVVTMAVKFLGYLLTGSVGLFSDAAESVVNLVAALVGLWAVTLAARPADEEHTYGHTKAEYFSSGVEGALILVAALVIAIEAIPRLLHPEPIKQAYVGLTFSVIGAVINGGLAWFMLREGKKQRSIIGTLWSRVKLNCRERWPARIQAN